LNLSAPKKWTFTVGAVLWIVGFLGMIFMADQYPLLGLGASAWIGMLGGLIIALGCLLEGF
jgi:hypothetical protein